MSNTLHHPSSLRNLWACRARSSCSGQRSLYENSCIPSSLQTHFSPQLMLKLLLLLQEKRDSLTVEEMYQNIKRGRKPMPKPFCLCMLTRAFCEQRSLCRHPLGLHLGSRIIKKHDPAEKPLLSLKAELCKRYSSLFLPQKAFWGEREGKKKKKEEVYGLPGQSKTRWLNTTTVGLFQLQLISNHNKTSQDIFNSQKLQH